MLNFQHYYARIFFSKMPFSTTFFKIDNRIWKWIQKYWLRFGFSKQKFFIQKVFFGVFPTKQLRLKFFKFVLTGEILQVERNFSFLKKLGKTFRNRNELNEWNLKAEKCLKFFCQSECIRKCGFSIYQKVADRNTFSLNHFARLASFYHCELHVHSLCLLVWIFFLNCLETKMTCAR